MNESNNTEAVNAVKKPKRRAIYLLPNLITSAALFFAFTSITFAIRGNAYAASLCIVAAGILDGMDGRVARLTNTQSEFGVQYDSLVDLISFGMAPAFLIWCTFARDINVFSFAHTISFIFLGCAALRLARFNVAAMSVDTDKKFFIGLPSPAGGGTLAAFVLFMPYMHFIEPKILSLIALGLTLLLGLLMVSRVRYYSFKEFGYMKSHPFQVLVFAFVFFVTLFSNLQTMLFPTAITYIASGIIYTFIIAPMNNMRTRKARREANL